MNRSVSRWKTILQRTLLCGSFAYAFLCFTACSGLQRKLIYFPPLTDVTRQDDFGRIAKLQRWTNASAQPIGWKRESPVQPATGSILVLHGNGCTALQCAHFADVIQQADALDVFIVEYPGYADRPGKPSEPSINRVAQEAFDALPKHRPIYLLGESLGTGVASYLASIHPDHVAGLVLFAPYNNLTDVAKAHAPILPVRTMLCDRYPSDDYLRNYRGRVAVLLGGRDFVVPARFGRQLYDGYEGPKRLWEFPTLNHGTIMTQPPDVWSQILSFLSGEDFRVATGKPAAAQ